MFLLYHAEVYCFCLIKQYNAFNVYRRELAPGTVSLTGDRAQGDDSKHWAYSSVLFLPYQAVVYCFYFIKQ